MLWYFGSKDIGVAHTLSRTFFWSENILWKEDLHQHHATVFLGSKDSIIDASQVRTYLEETGRTMLQDASKAEKTAVGEDLKDCNCNLNVVWCDGLNHGEVFDLPIWRSRLKDEIISEAKHQSRDRKAPIPLSASNSELTLPSRLEDDRQTQASKLCCLTQALPA